MRSRYVLDTEAIVAFLYDEPGGEQVRGVLDSVRAGDTEGFLAKANASEVLYLVARFEGTASEAPTRESLRVADRDVWAIERAGVTIESADWRTTGEVKAHGAISLADAAAVSLADEYDATLLVGADDDFDGLPLDVTVERIRTDGV